MAKTLKLNEKDTGLLAFLIIHMEGQVERIEADKNFHKLDDDAKLAHGGLAKSIKLLNELYKRNIA